MTFNDNWELLYFSRRAEFRLNTKIPSTPYLTFVYICFEQPMQKK